MAKRPTYEELEQRIRELEKEAVGRMRAEEDLRESNERYRTAIEYSNDGIAIVKGDNHLYINKKFVEMFGYDRPEEIVGKRISMVIHPRDRERVTEFNRLRQEGNPEPSSYECEGLRKNGEAIYLEVSATKSIYRGEPVSLVFLRDVTQRRQAEDLLRKQAQELRNRVKELNCLYGISSLVERLGTSLEEMVQETLHIIPPAYQYPEITCARMVLNGQVYSTKNFKETIWKQSIDIIAYDNRIGSLKVCYLEERPEIDEGPFRNEERDLLNAIARRLGRSVERMRAEKALTESEERYRTLVESTSDAVLMLDVERKVVSYNRAFLDLFGYGREEVEGKSIRIIHKSDESFHALGEHLYPVIKKVGTCRTEWEFLHKDGTAFPVETVTSALKSPDGSITGYVAIIRDITERRQAEDALRESEAQKSAILDASVDRIRYVDKDMKIIWANRTTATVLGVSPEKLVGRTCHEIFVGRDTPCEGCPTVRARETGQIEGAVIYHHDIKGFEGESYWENYSVPLKNKSGEIVSLIQIGRNITNRKLAEERIHILSQQLLKAQENERQRISRYLHDHVGQELSIISIGCETLFDDYPDAPPEKREKLSELSEIIQGTITSVRGLAYDLRPPGLDQLGLVQAVFRYCEDFSENTGVSLDFQAAGMDSLSVDPDIEINLYRLVQEGLNNIKKHAEADHVIIRLVASFPNIILRIEDDGKGFDVEGRLLRASKEKRMGLGSMEERVSLLNGKLRIKSRLKEGTKIFIEIPFKEKKSG